MKIPLFAMANRFVPLCQSKAMNDEYYWYKICPFVRWGERGAFEIGKLCEYILLWSLSCCHFNGPLKGLTTKRRGWRVQSMPVAKAPFKDHVLPIILCMCANHQNIILAANNISSTHNSGNVNKDRKQNFPFPSTTFRNVSCSKAMACWQRSFED